MIKFQLELFFNYFLFVLKPSLHNRTTITCSSAKESLTLRVFGVVNIVVNHCKRSFFKLEQVSLGSNSGKTVPVVNHFNIEQDKKQEKKNAISSHFSDDVFKTEGYRM